jgi:hypothetical protein
MDRRRGKFTLSRCFLEDADYSVLQHVMRGVIVLHTESNFATDEITYWAIHPDFEENPPGAIIPTYELRLTETHRRWKKIATT